MEMVSAVRMRKLKQYMADSDMYLQGLKQTISDIVTNEKIQDNKYLQTYEGANQNLVIFIATHRGFVGSLNAKLGEKLNELSTEILSKKQQLSLITIKRKTLNLAGRYGLNSDYHFPESFEEADLNKILSIKSIILEKWATGKIANVYLIYPKFISMANQSPVIEKLMPLTVEYLEKKTIKPYKFEPSATEIINQLFSDYLEITLYRGMLEASVSEYASRMKSMHNATENADELIENLNLLYNKTRQSTITRQIQENINANLVNMRKINL